MTPRLLLSIASLTALLSLCAAASADVPSPDPRCYADGPGCTECWRSSGSRGSSQIPFEECRDAAKAKGLVEACHHREGTGDVVLFCPQGVKVETRIAGGGCAGCTIDAAATPGTIAAIAVALGAFALRRRRARRSPSRLPKRGIPRGPARHDDR